MTSNGDAEMLAWLRECAGNLFVVNRGYLVFLLRLLDSRDAALREAREERDRLRAVLQQATDKLVHYAIDYPQPNTLRIINDCDRILARSQPATPSPVPPQQKTPKEIREDCASIAEAWIKRGDPDIYLLPTALRSLSLLRSSVSANGDNDGKQPLPEDVERIARALLAARYGPIADVVWREKWARINDTDPYLPRQAKAAMAAMPPATVAARQDAIEAPDESKQSGNPDPASDSGQPEAGSSGASAEDVDRAGGDNGLTQAARTLLTELQWIILGDESTPDPESMAAILKALSTARAEGERAGLERAAKKAEDFGHSNGRILAAHKHVAAAIRALLPPAAPETKP